MYLHQHEMFHLPALLYNLFSSGFPPERVKDSIAEGIERLPKQIETSRLHGQIIVPTFAF
jgi:hypothetical protein